MKNYTKNDFSIELTLKLYDISQGEEKIIKSFNFTNFNYVLKEHDFQLQTEEKFYTLEKIDNDGYFIVQWNEESKTEKLFKLTIDLPENTILDKEVWLKMISLFRIYIIKNHDKFFEKEEDYHQFIFNRDDLQIYNSEINIEMDLLNIFEDIDDLILEIAENKELDNFKHYSKTTHEDLKTIKDIFLLIEDLDKWISNKQIRDIVLELLEKKKKICQMTIIKAIKSLEWRPALEEIENIFKTNASEKKYIQNVAEKIMQVMDEDYNLREDVYSYVSNKRMANDLSTFIVLEKVLPNLEKIDYLANTNNYSNWLEENREILLNQSELISTMNMSYRLAYEIRQQLKNLNFKIERILNLDNYVDFLNDHEEYKKQISKIDIAIKKLI